MKFTKCPRCGEITLEIKPNGEAYCENCHHYEQHVPKRQDFDDWVASKGGCDFIDELGKVEGMRIAFLAGIQAQQDTEIARLDKEISLLQRQAE